MNINELKQGFSFPGGDTAVLLIHGLCGTAAELYPLGVELNHRGLSVCGMRVAAHGTDIAELDRCSWRDWTDSARSAYLQLRDKYARVHVAGHSNGSLLALWLGENEHPDSVTAISPPLKLKIHGSSFAGALQYLVPHMTFAGGKLVLPDDNEKYMIGYDLSSVHGIAEMNKLARNVRAGLPQLSAPLLAVSSRCDPLVDPRSLNIITDGAASAVKRELLCEKSGHMLPLDVDFPQLCDALYNHISMSDEPAKK